MTITSIEQISRRQNRVCVDGEPAFTISDKGLRDLGISISEGKELSEEDSSALMKEAERLAAKCAMDHLVRRDYSEEELYQLLIRKGFSPQLACQGIAYVDSYGYLDDERYARQYISSKKGTVSRMKLIYALRKKGVSDDITESVLAEEGWDDTEGARHMILKKYRPQNMPAKGSRDYQKLCRSLISRGYSFGSIRSAYDSILADEDEEI